MISTAKSAFVIAGYGIARETVLTCHVKPVNQLYFNIAYQFERCEQSGVHFQQMVRGGGGLREGRVGTPKNYSQFCKKKHLLLAKLALKDVIQYSAKYFNSYH